MDDDTRRIQRAPITVCILVAHGIEVCGGYIVANIIAVIIDGDSRRGLWMWLYQHFAVLGQHEFATVLYPFRVVFIIDKIGRYICFWSIILFKIISVIVAFVFIIKTISILNTYKEFTILLIGTIHITNIATTKDIAVTPFHAFV